MTTFKTNVNRMSKSDGAKFKCPSLITEIKNRKKGKVKEGNKHNSFAKKEN